MSTRYEREREWVRNYRWAKAIRAAAYARAKCRRFGVQVDNVHWSVFVRLHHLPCAYCGATPALFVDHETPISRGGRNVIENLAPACRRCNEAKGDRTPEEWSASLEPYPCAGCGELITPVPQRVRKTYCSNRCGWARPVTDRQRAVLLAQAQRNRERAEGLSA